MTAAALWDKCLERLKEEFPPQKFNTWIRPLQLEDRSDILRLLAPNQFVYEWINERYLARINELIADLSSGNVLELELGIGSKQMANTATPALEVDSQVKEITKQILPKPTKVVSTERFSTVYHSNLNRTFTFDNFFEGKFN